MDLSDVHTLEAGHSRVGAECRLMCTNRCCDRAVPKVQAYKAGSDVASGGKARGERAWETHTLAEQ